MVDLQSDLFLMWTMLLSDAATAVVGRASAAMVASTTPAKVMETFFIGFSFQIEKQAGF